MAAFSALFVASALLALPPRRRAGRRPSAHLQFVAGLASAWLRLASAQYPSGLYYRYDATVGTTVSDFVTDRSGNGRDAVVSQSRGLAISTDAPGTWGVASTCPYSLTYLSGNYSSQAR